MHCEPMYTVELEYDVCACVHGTFRLQTLWHCEFICMWSRDAPYAHNSPTTAKRKSALVSC